MICNIEVQVDDIDVLLKKKRAAPEMGMEPPVHSINVFIESELERLESVILPTAPRRDVLSMLNEVFRLSRSQGWA